MEYRCNKERAKLLVEEKFTGVSITSNEDIIDQINYILSSKKECVINIVNDGVSIK